MADWQFTPTESGVPEVSDVLRRAQSRMERLAKKTGRAADKLARREGAIAGALDAAQGQLKLRNDGTIYGAAHDEAAIVTYLQRMDITIAEQADRVLEQHPDDPAAAQAALDKARQEAVAAVPDALKPQVDIMYRRRTLRVRQAAKAKFEQRQRQEWVATLDAWIAARESELLRLAGVTDPQDAEGQQALESELAATEAELQQAVARGEITPLVAQRKMRSLRQQVLEMQVRGLVERQPTPAAKWELVKRLDAQWREGKGPVAKLPADAWMTLKAQLQAEAKAAEAQATAPAKAAMRRVLMDIRSGRPPSELDIGLLERTAAQGSAKVAAALDRARTAGKLLRLVSGLSLPEAERVAQEARAKAKQEPNEDNILLADAVEQRVEWLRKRLADDPLSVAGQAGIIKDAAQVMQPLTAASAPEQWRRRLEVAEGVAAHYGVRPRYLTRDERRALKNQWDEMNAQQRTLFLRNLRAGAKDRADAILMELGVDKPEIQHLGALAQWTPENAAAALAGMDLKKAGVVQLPAREAREQFLQLARQALPQQANLAGLKKATDGIYAKLAAEQGVTDFDEDLYREAFERALGKGAEGGGIAEWQGRKLALPPNLTPDAFAEKMRRLRDEDLAKVSATGGAPVFMTRKGARQVGAGELREMHLVPAGVGLFQVYNLDPAEGGKPLLDEKTGRPWVLNAALLARVRLPPPADETPPDEPPIANPLAEYLRKVP